jgi:hypothetical protein
MLKYALIAALLLSATMVVGLATPVFAGGPSRKNCRDAWNNPLTGNALLQCHKWIEACQANLPRQACLTRGDGQFPAQPVRLWRPIVDSIKDRDMGRILSRRANVP